MGAHWAAISDFASLSTFDNFANFSGSGKFKFGADGANVAIEKGDNLIFVLDGTSGKVANQSFVALSGFGVGQDGKSSFIVFFGGSLSTS